MAAISVKLAGKVIEPEARLIVLAVRPSPARISIIKSEAYMYERFRKAAEADERITYLAGSCDRFLDSAGRPIHELYVEDGLHMSPKGYEIWKEILSPHLKVPAGE